MRNYTLTHMATLSKNFYFNLRRDHKKNSYGRRDYESADEKGLKNYEKRIQAVKG